MDFTPIIPTDMRGNINESLMIKTEQLIEKSAALAGSHTPQLINTLKEHLLTVNSYYSNLIESEGTRISDIERAMKNDYSHDIKIEKLQRLSVAHIDVKKRLSLHSMRIRLYLLTAKLLYLGFIKVFI